MSCDSMIRRGTMVLSLALAAALGGAGGGCSSERVLVAGPSTPAEAPATAWRPSGEGAATNSYGAACPEFASHAAVRQKEETFWCWAACAQMVHKYVGQREFTQEEIAARIHGYAEGEDETLPATYWEIMLALCPDEAKTFEEYLQREIEKKRLTDSVGVEFNVAKHIRGQLGELFPVNSDTIVQELQRRMPVVVVLRQGEDSTVNHACVLHSAGFAVESPNLAVQTLHNTLQGTVIDPLGTPRFFSLRWVEIIDPADGKSHRLTAEEFRDRVDFMISKERAAAIIKEQRAIVTLN